MPLDPTPPEPLDPDLQSAFPLPGIEVPRQFYWANTSPAPLAGMELPRGAMPWEQLHVAGFRKVACLCSERPLYDPSPLQWLVALELCDLVEQPLPEDPVAEEKAIRLIARAIVAALGKGEGVIVHCAGGRGRTGTVLGCVLRELGHGADEVVAYLDAVNRRRGKDGWPEAAWQREVVEREAGSR